ncbi:MULTISPECIES: cytochrome c oxidase assembly protein [Oceanobacillus]|uniref:Cytochrome c oxidase assembly protein n=1 Tax=Oceanobacillus aidingensis TaxID=645964 RepID=A0ABV9K384_9BACI|nr:cytochrome c oxidase assembly protein [Oceanobacillus oncorhynchi]MDM8099596.1 cytochrome c oxidase assembly protein [Oceanobacillus oncorhynchi]UUI41951.1 cytochrome c oxidase assembly protein [Oceanobacillus oncorhynchi]
MIAIFLDEFHFSTLWNGGIFLFCAFMIVCYFFMIPSKGKSGMLYIISFLFGMVVLFLSVGSPLNIIGRLTLQAHMYQIVGLLFVAAPLLVIGWRPKSWISEKISWIQSALAYFRKPAVAITLLTVFFYGYHLPFMFDIARIELYWNHFFMMCLFLAALNFWAAFFYYWLNNRVRWYATAVQISAFLPYCFYGLLAGSGIYQTYKDPAVFLESLRVCIPVDLQMPDEFYIGFLPFDPVYEQQMGILIFLFSIALVFVITLVWSQRQFKNEKG